MGTEMMNALVLHAVGDARYWIHHLIDNNVAGSVPAGVQ